MPNSEQDANPSLFRHGCGKTWHCHRLMTVPRKTSGGGRRRTEICEEVAKHLWYYGGKMAIWRCKGILRCEFMMPMPISYISIHVRILDGEGRSPFCSARLVSVKMICMLCHAMPI